MSEWRLDLGVRRPLSMNGRTNRYVYARVTKEFRELAYWRCREAKIPPLGRAEIELHYAPRNRGRHDSINLSPTLKACEDGVVDAKVIPDDTPEFINPTPPIIDAPTGQPGRMYLIIRQAGTRTVS